jgi:membrane protein implicated in regulation of membrane protease activity
MNAQWLLSWWNLIFILPFGLALLYLGIYSVSGWTFGESDVDADADADVDADADAGVDHDIDADADADVDHDIDHDVDTDADADADADSDSDAEHDAEHETASNGSSSSSVWHAMHLLGVGSVPVSMVLLFLLLTWGGIGFLTNQAARPHVAQPWMVAAVSLPIAALGSLLITSILTRTIGKYMPMRETYARRRHELLGSTGEAIYEIDEKFGMVSIRDDHGDLFQVPCRLEQGYGAIPKGGRVKLVAYDKGQSLFYVLPDAKNN